ncbi:MAG: sugar isomerase, partial [Mucilaginibacter sp.]
MQLGRHKIEEHNTRGLAEHKRRFEFTAGTIQNLDNILQKLEAFNIAIPSWALGTGGTRFGRFSGGGEPRNLEEKIEDVGLIHALN